MDQGKGWELAGRRPAKIWTNAHAPAGQLFYRCVEKSYDVGSPAKMRITFQAAEVALWVFSHLAAKRRFRGDLVETAGRDRRPLKLAERAYDIWSWLGLDVLGDSLVKKLSSEGQFRVGFLDSGLKAPASFRNSPVHAAVSKGLAAGSRIDSNMMSHRNSFRQGAIYRGWKRSNCTSTNEPYWAPLSVKPDAALRFAGTSAC
ncbi:hypothetical protein [Pararhizobium sp. O133]|uniref:hypothetical protein n=1 Tax=Pararhizobium sp. O133 TaxID=3449278 RepID=UPI003F684B74